LITVALLAVATAPFTVCATPAAATCWADVVTQVEQRVEHSGVGTVGFSIQGAVGPAVSIAGGVRFPQQSVFKLPTAVALLDQVDRRVIRLDEPVAFGPDDRTLSTAPLDVLIDRGLRSLPVQELLRRMLVDSDNTATDVLLRRLGGPAVVQRLLDQRGYAIRVDRGEREMQADFLGISPSDVPSEVRALPGSISHLRSTAAARGAAARYLLDPRDTATPAALTQLLVDLQRGNVLSPKSTALLLSYLQDTQVTTKRLKAGLPRGWRIAQRGGTSWSVDGHFPTYNNVGIIYRPDGRWVAAAVLVKDSGVAGDALDAMFQSISRDIAASSCW